MFHLHASGDSVRDFFNQVSSDYDDSIRRTIPPYQEMFEALVGYCFINRQKPLSILELGCGTGNLSLLLSQVFPQTHLTLVDLSPEMLEQTAAKLSPYHNRYHLVEGSFMDVHFPEQSFDLVVSSIALHHLLDSEKPVLYQKIYGWLKAGGLFRCADEVQTLPAEPSLAKNLKRWREWASEYGATPEELAFWTEHGEKYDHYASLHDHFQWLDEAGFTEVDCYWKQVFWCVFGGEKKR